MQEISEDYKRQNYYSLNAIYFCAECFQSEYWLGSSESETNTKGKEIGKANATDNTKRFRTNFDGQRVSESKSNPKRE